VSVFGSSVLELPPLQYIPRPHAAVWAEQRLVHPSKMNTKIMITSDERLEVSTWGSKRDQMGCLDSDLNYLEMKRSIFRGSERLLIPL
jgi:hypothetical protein